MSDYFGDNQLRVLDSTDRSFEEVIYQYKKPPLSSEMNLNGRISSGQNRQVLSSVLPSGWNIVGKIHADIPEASCHVGDVVTSSSYTRNTFKMISKNLGILGSNLFATVNGWTILIQGTGCADENNVITLINPPVIGNRVDFVFLEVWRRLITPSDVVYKYGNVLYGGTNPANDLIDPVIGMETSLRVQVQYRIRSIDIDIEDYRDGFDPNSVFAQGPLSGPLSCTMANFLPVAGSLGLWRAGSGDAAAQEALETVDGYVYAIPMFAVRRRNTGAYDPDTRSNGSVRTLANYQSGIASDRPDNLYNDWVVADDILDMRHRILPVGNLKDICEDGFRQVITGHLRGKMAKYSYGEECFGPVLVVADAVSSPSTDKPGSEKIGDSDGIRRVFSNAALTQPETIAIKTTADKTNVGAWIGGDRVYLTTSGYPAGTTITGVQQLFTHNSILTGADATAEATYPATTVTIRIVNGGSLVGTTIPIRAEYALSFPSGPNGLSTLPDSFLECRKEDSTVCVATKDMIIRARNLSPVIANDGTHFNMLINRGGSTTEQYDFGHQMTYHVLGNATEYVSVPRIIDGQEIIGVLKAKVGTTYRTISVARSATSYTVGLGSPAVSINTDIELTLYTGTKFFDMNKQGRAITDCYKISEYVPLEAPNGVLTVFHIDTTNQAILKIASDINLNGSGTAYVNGVRKVLRTVNRQFPTDSTKSRIEIEFQSADKPQTGELIEVPVLHRSAISVGEGYTFFYQATPYQGLMDSTVTGIISSVGQAIVTTAGSGTITDYTYASGTAAFTVDSSMVIGAGTEWLANIKAGDMIYCNGLPKKGYLIKEVFSNSTIYLNTLAIDSTTGSYTVVRKDAPYYGLSNIIDRMPALYSAYDSSALNETVATSVTEGFPVLETRVVSRTQDILDSTNFVLGENTAGRGRSTINVNGPIGLGNIGVRFEKLDSSGHYQKTYQSYALNNEADGRTYLMVIGSETDNTSRYRFFNQSSSSDVVDIFELPGRPLIQGTI